MLTTADMETIARRHGLDMSQVEPDSLDQRLAKLRHCLSNRDVPYPINPQLAERYYQSAAAGEPFAIGSLSGESVELGQYANCQRYDDYTIEDHLSWACLIAEQQRTKHRFACQEYLDGESMFAIGGQVIPDF